MRGSGGGEGERGRARYTHLSFHSSRQDKKKKKKKNDDEEREEKEAFLLELARRLSLASGIKTFQYGHFLIKSSSSRSNIEAWAWKTGVEKDSPVSKKVRPRSRSQGNVGVGGETRRVVSKRGFAVVVYKLAGVRRGMGRPLRRVELHPKTTLTSRRLKIGMLSLNRVCAVCLIN